MSTEKIPDGQGQVCIAMNELENIVSNLEGVSESLRGKLSPILKPDIPGPLSNLNPKAKDITPMSDIAGGINEQVGKLYAVYGTLVNLTKRIDL